ncbi:MAG TPA: prolyl oligopeptidase family serine peptidase [Pirellulales bacterium]
MHKLSFLFALVAAALVQVAGAEEPGVRHSVWNGFERLDFEVAGRAALLIVPKQAAPGRPWIWRTEFFGHEPQADVALLGKGFHAAYINVQNMYGGPEAMRLMDAFYADLRQRHQLAAKAVLEGFSRGGLFAFNWAARNPDKVACIYADAPVCDFKSWPGGKGRGPGSKADWERCLRAYGLTEAEALVYKLNPVDNLSPLARAGIPLLLVCGDADDVVPMPENTRLVEERYKQLGGSIAVIAKPGVKHHPHSLADPAPIVNFVLEHTGRQAGKAQR